MTVTPMFTNTTTSPEDLNNIVVWGGEDWKEDTIDFTPFLAALPRVEVRSTPKGKHHRPPDANATTAIPESVANLYDELRNLETYPPEPLTLDPSDMPIPILNTGGYVVPRGGLRGFLSRLGRRMRGFGETDTTKRTYCVTLVNEHGEKHIECVDIVGTRLQEVQDKAMADLALRHPMWSQWTWAVLNCEQVYPFPPSPRGE